MIRRRNVADEIAGILQHKIVELNLKEGDKLPSHEVLSQELGVSKASLREGLQKLSVMGLVDLRQGLGTIVATPSISNFFKILSPRLVSLGCSLSDLFDARIWIEVYTAAEAAKKRDQQDLMQMSTLLSEMENSISRGDSESFSRADMDFHICIAKAAKNVVLVEMLRTITELILFHDNLVHRKPGGSEISFTYHRQIYTAISDEDPDAAKQAMVNHIENVKSQKSPDLIIYCDSLGAGSIGGTFFSVGNALAKVMSKYTWVKAKTEPTGGGIDNLIKVDEKSFGLGITQSDIALQAYMGTGEFRKKYKDIRAICGAHHLDMQVATLAKNRIHSIRDLAGKKVALGAPGGGSRWVSELILKKYGLHEGDFQPEYLPYSKAVNALKQERIAAVFFLSGGPSNALLELSESVSISLLPLDMEILREIVEEHHYWTISEIAANTYINQSDSIPTLGISCILITHKNAGDETVYAIVKSLMEHTDEIASEHPAGADYCLKKALEGVTIPIHPGAQRYFLERHMTHPLLGKQPRIDQKTAGKKEPFDSRGLHP